MKTCRLCLTETSLIKAHVIPECFMSLPPAEEGVAKILTNSPGRYPKKMRTGIYDKGILCAKCDARLGLLDQHAAERLVRSNAIEEVPIGHRVYRKYLSADPLLTHQFAASVVWRASISSHEFFAKVKLGPYQEIIRNSLLREERDARVGTLLAEFDVPDVAILNPQSTRFDGVNFWVLYANRFIIYLKVDQRPMPGYFAELELRAGRCTASIIRSLNDSKELGVLKKLAFANPTAFGPRRTE